MFDSPLPPNLAVQFPQEVHDAVRAFLDEFIPPARHERARLDLYLLALAAQKAQLQDAIHNYENAKRI